MKTLIIVSIALSILLVACTSPLTTSSVGAVAAAEAPEDEAQEALVATEACPICGYDLSDYQGELSEDEVLGLLLALNDEYHAWAVYDQVLKDHGQVRPFSSIIGSEAKHIDSLVGLFETYGLTIPENPWIGNVPSFATSQEACEVGVEAEIANVALYDEIVPTTEREDILRVYDALQRASQEKHLPAFQRCAG